MNEPMDQFGKVLECAKCGYDATAASVVYRQEPNFRPGDYIERTCKRCGYHWKERPLDSPSPAILRGLARGKP